jgi:NDP-sugar pyrophosphorylase family protein
VDLSKLLKFHTENASDWTFSLFTTSEPGRYMEIDVASNGKITILKSCIKLQNHFANGGAYLVSPAALKKSGFKSGEKFSLEDELLPSLMKMKCNLFGLEFVKSFIDIGVPQDYSRVTELLRK